MFSMNYPSKILVMPSRVKTLKDTSVVFLDFFSQEVVSGQVHVTEVVLKTIIETILKNDLATVNTDIHN